ncbi:MarR family transcriptional regulator [Streptomyces sp. NP160]|nr:MarR family transcriptional regulator [Streptomyces sp. NP160]
MMVGVDDSAEGVEDLVAASRALLGVVARSLAPALEEVTVPQFRLLVLASELGPVRSGDLAERLAVSGSTLTRTVDRLVAGGWLERRAGASDRREVLVAATEAGLLLVREVTDRRRAELARVVARLSPQERAVLAQGAAAFRRAAGEPLPEELSPYGG